MPYVGLTSLFPRLVFNTQLGSDTLMVICRDQQQVRSVLNQAYYGRLSDGANSFMIGSYAKETIIGPRSNVDLLFELPSDLYHRFAGREDNMQLQILRDVTDVLLSRFPSAALRADGQAIVVPFRTYAVEVRPAFQLENGYYGHPDPNNDGFWRTTDPVAERKQLVQSDAETGGKTLHLIRMAKAWKRAKKVEITSFVLELLAVQFLTTWRLNLNRSGSVTGYNVYDFMLRDFFSFLLSNAGRNIWFSETGEVLEIGGGWEEKAREAAAVARTATELGAEDRIDEAEQEWRKIFGRYLY